VWFWSAITDLSFLTLPAAAQGVGNGLGLEAHAVSRKRKRDLPAGDSRQSLVVRGCRTTEHSDGMSQGTASYSIFGRKLWRKAWLGFRLELGFPGGALVLEGIRSLCLVRGATYCRILSHRQINVYGCFVPAVPVDGPRFRLRTLRPTPFSDGWDG
jgi:hypothetical protein